MSKLTAVFDDKIKAKRDAYAGANLTTYKLYEDVGKIDVPILKPSAAKKIYDLDVLAHTAI